MPPRQKYRLRARSDREVIREAEPGKRYIDRDSGEEWTVHAAYAVGGQYQTDWHGLVIDWLSVPAAVYFVWVVRGLSAGRRTDWTEGAEGVRLAAAAA